MTNDPITNAPRATTGARPTGVTILAVLAVIGGIFSLLGALAGLAGGALVATSGGGALGGLVAVIGLVALVMGILYFALAYGFWNLKPWAWTLGIALAAISIVLAVLGILGDSSTLISQIISIAISGAIIYYLWQPHVKAAFGRPA